MTIAGNGPFLGHTRLLCYFLCANFILPYSLLLPEIQEGGRQATEWFEAEFGNAHSEFHIGAEGDRVEEYLSKDII